MLVINKKPGPSLSVWRQTRNRWKGLWHTWSFFSWNFVEGTDRETRNACLREEHVRWDMTNARLIRGTGGWARGRGTQLARVTQASAMTKAETHSNRKGLDVMPCSALEVSVWWGKRRRKNQEAGMPPVLYFWRIICNCVGGRLERVRSFRLGF